MRGLVATVSAGAILVSGCATNAVTFVTNTGIGIDADTTTQTVSIAYDRIDGYLAPRYPNGSVPPVVSSVQSSLDIFTPQIVQVYATGNAALVLAAAKPDRQVQECKYRDGDFVVDSKDSSQNKRVMFFGTSTTVGLKLGFSSAGATSLNLGYKRKEASIIPLGTTTDSEKKNTDAYPSVIASINLRISTGKTIQDTTLPLSEFFATGVAADCLATLPAVHDNFDTLSKTATTAVKTSGNAAVPPLSK
jgi:hypothetical protein